MSDARFIFNGLDLSGIIVRAVLVVSAAGFGVCCLVSGLIALIRGGWSKNGLISRSAFGFFSSSIALVFFDLFLYGVITVFDDSMTREFRETIDRVALYVWLPVQPVFWIAAALIFNKLRKTT